MHSGKSLQLESNGFPPVFWGILVALGAFLIFFKLDHTLLWDDEATTGYFARTLLNTGHLSAWDGHNFYTYRNGTLVTGYPQYEYNNSPGECYIAALSFYLGGGESTWLARFPFALMGVLSLILAAFALRISYKKDARTASIHFLLLVLSIQYILFMRQAHYYAPVALLAFSCWIFYTRYFEQRKYIDIALATLSFILMFFCHYLISVVFAATLISHALLYNRSRMNHMVIVQIFIAALFTSILLGFYILKNRIYDRPDFVQTLPWWQRKIMLVWFTTTDISRIGIIPWPIGIAFAYLWIKGHISTVSKRLFLTGLIYTFWIIIASPQIIDEITGSCDVRYMIPALPFLLAAPAAVFGYLWEKYFKLSILLIVVFSCTNILSLFPDNPKPRLTIPGLVRQCIEPFPTAYSECLEYLKQNLHDDDKLLTVPEFHAVPLAYYYGQHFYWSGGLDLQSYHIIDEMESAPFPEYTIMQHVIPDWIIGFGKTQELEKTLNYYTDRLRKERDSISNYIQVAQVPVYAWGLDISRPELFWHSFGPPTNRDASKEELYIFKKK